ncbi:DJ-1/PfpI family protein [Cryptosporangium aurantiacum]|uniref:DJ-1/PfpI family protein n=1 Tax=Cryptosporangium aurantiacum TaxID=134849 RepID=A0A1M7R1G5_9ACTN|nr:DJ-1/PfpI family protein [Cryptosporangium aurantiacum]SHN38448.1 DJ-1/PfpI family protein [Cryptosporangium aurantiacum]
MRRILTRAARIAVYLVAFVVPPVLISVVGVRAALADRYEPPPGERSAQVAVPAHDPAKPTAVVLLNHGGTEVTDALAPFQVFAESGAFNVYLAAPTKRQVTLSGGLDVLPQLSLAELDRRLGGRSPDVVVVPAMWRVGSAGQRPVADWLRKHAPSIGTLMSVCDGAEVLADAGLLEGRRATASWANLAKWEKRHPDVKWVRGSRYVQDGTVLTSAGVTSGVVAALHVVRDRLGEPAATALAERIGYPDTRLGDEPRIPVDALSPADRALYVLRGAWTPHKPQIGVVVTEGASEIELASAFDAYPGPAFTSRTTSLGPSSVRSAHGLTFVPRYALDDPPELDRLVVPGRTVPPRVRSQVEDTGIRPYYVHVGSDGFPFDATLRDLAEHENVPLTRFNARLLEYPTGHLSLTGPGWPVLPTVLLVTAGLLGLAIVGALDVVIRRRRAP